MVFLCLPAGRPDTAADTFEMADEDEDGFGVISISSSSDEDE